MREIIVTSEYAWSIILELGVCIPPTTVTCNQPQSSSKIRDLPVKIEAWSLVTPAQDTIELANRFEKVLDGIDGQKVIGHFAPRGHLFNCLNDHEEGQCVFIVLRIATVDCKWKRRGIDALYSVMWPSESGNGQPDRHTIDRQRTDRVYMNQL